jgi:hypothetical protein
MVVAPREVSSRKRQVRLFSLNGQFPAIAVGIVKPEAHVGRARSFRANFVSGILKFSADLLQVIKRFAQGGQVGQVKRHVADSFRRRTAFENRNRDVVIPDGDAILEVELLLESQRALEPLCTLLRVAYGQAKVTDGAESEWNAHGYL